MGADVFGIAVVDMLPGLFHAGDFCGVVEMAEERLFELFGGRTGNDAGDVHIGVAGAGKTEVDDADDFVVVV